MKPLTTACCAASFIAGAAWAGTVNFDNARPGELPAHWTGTMTGKGKPKWTVERDDYRFGAQ